MDINKQGFTKNDLITLFESQSDQLDFSFGTVIIQPGERVPAEGFSNHEENEYSIIIEGSIEGESGGKPFKVNAPEATLIPAGEKHWAINNGDKPCKIVWTLVQEKK